MNEYDHPASYRPLAAYHDLLMAHVDYEEWVAYVLDRLGLPQRVPVDSESGDEPPALLDLACGTGTIAVALAQRGYRVIGVDRSEEMLAVAEEKARRAGVDLFLICQDMRSFELAEQVDAALSLFDSLNYLVEEGDLTRALTQTAAASTRSSLSL